MTDTIRVEDMPVAQISRLLATDASGLTADEIVALENFVKKIGGAENARAAIRMLSMLEGSG